MSEEELKIEKLAETYPSNAKADCQPKPSVEDKAQPVGRKTITKVVVNPVKQKKRGLGKKLAETFLEDDTRTVGDYILHDILIPAAKDLINDIFIGSTDMVVGNIQMILFGERRGRYDYRSGRSGSPSRINYGAISSRPSRDRDRDRDRRDISRSSRARHDFDDILFRTRGEAEEVLSLLQDSIYDYKEARVSELYQLTGITGDFADERWGWTDLRGVNVTRVRNGDYVINFPRPQLLD